MSQKLVRFMQAIFFPMEIIAVVLISLRYFLEDSRLYSGIGFVLLAALYFLYVYFPAKPGMSGFLSFSRKMLGVGMSLSVVGIMFSLWELAGATTLLTIGIIVVILSLLMILVEILRKPDSTGFVKFSVIRGLIILALSALILYFRDSADTL